MLRMGDLLKVCRTQAGLSQKDLATRAHTTQGYICAVEKGKAVPRIDWLETALGICGYELGVREKM